VSLREKLRGQAKLEVEMLVKGTTELARESAQNVGIDADTFIKCLGTYPDTAIRVAIRQRLDAIENEMFELYATKNSLPLEAKDEKASNA